jgi:hypothetical protein
MSEKDSAAVLQRLRSEIQTQMMQDLMSKITENCFKVGDGEHPNTFVSTIPTFSISWFVFPI